MPKLTNSLPKYQKHRASGQAVVTLNGADHYLGPHGTKASKIKFDQLITERMANGRRLPAAASEESGIKITELLADYMKWAKGYYRLKPYLERMGLSRRSLKVLYGTTPAAEFGPLKLTAIRQRWNSLFYKTQRGADVGDLFMSLIHTCELNGVNPFDDLTELERHSDELSANPHAWLP